MPLVPSPADAAAATRERQAAHRDQWVAALKSGHYTQGRGVLRRATPSHTDYCCLGVACELFRTATDHPYTAEWTPTDGFVVYTKPDEAGEQHLAGSNRLGLPIPVLRWLGLADVSGKFNEPDTVGRTYYTYLTDLNDRGTSFDAIADIIQREPKGLVA